MKTLRVAAALVSLLVIASESSAAVSPGASPKPIGLPSAIPAPLPTAAIGTCGPVGSGLGEIDGTIYDPQIATYATQPVFAKSTVIVYPAAADPTNAYLTAINKALQNAYTMAIAQRNAQANQSSSTSTSQSTQTAAQASIYAMQQYGITQAAAAGAYSAVGSQSESAQISGNGQFRCLGLPLGKVLVQMIVTEFFNDPSGATITRYYQGVGLATKISATGLPTSFLLLSCLGSIPYSLTYASDNCPAKKH